MIFFDYIYYRVYSLYRDKWHEEDPKLYAVGIVSLMQEFNLGAILFLLIYHLEIKIERIYIFLFYIILFVFNMLWYSKLRIYNNLSKKWNSEAKNKKTIRGILILLYILLSILVFFKTAVFVGKMMK